MKTSLTEKKYDVTNLSNVCDVLDNLRRPINSDERNARVAGKPISELFPYYGATGQVGWIDDYLTDDEYVLIGEDGAPFLDKFKPKAYIIKGKTWVNNHAHILKAKDSLATNKFILHFLNSFNYIGYVNGTTRLKLTKGSLVTIPIPKPSIEEQDVIVSKIEELFSKLDNGVANLKAMRQQLKVYRQAVLNHFVDLNELSPIESVIETIDQGWSPKCENFPATNGEWCVIKTSAIQHGEFRPHENKALPKNLSPKEQHEIIEGDILITRAGPRVRVGVCCLVRKTPKRVMNCDKAYRLRLNKKIILPEYLEFILNTPVYMRQIEAMKTGISDSGLNLTQKGFLKIKIPTPTIQQQKIVIQEIESRLSVADKIEETINNSLKEAEALRQSILKQAFEGKLV